MNLVSYLNEYFSDGLPYDDAVHLALAIYSATDILPVELCPEEMTMEAIAQSFASLASSGKILDYCADNAVLFGVNYHKVTDKGHWIEVLSSIFKIGTEVDFHRVNLLFSRSKN